MLCFSRIDNSERILRVRKLRDSISFCDEPVFQVELLINKLLSYEDYIAELEHELSRLRSVRSTFVPF